MKWPKTLTEERQKVDIAIKRIVPQYNLYDKRNYKRFGAQHVPGYSSPIGKEQGQSKPSKKNGKY